MKPTILFLLLYCFLHFSCTNPDTGGTGKENRAVLDEARRTKRLITGKVVGISDGDTFRLLVDGNKTIRVRLYGVDAPERAQDYSTQSRQALSDLVFSKEVAVVQKNRDRYGRIVGLAFRGDLNVNEALLEQGLVWQYTQYDRNEHWADLQAAAKAAKRGLWQQPNPTPPWQWRKQRKQEVEAEE